MDWVWAKVIELIKWKAMVTCCIPSIDACIHSRNVRWSEWSGNQWRGATAASETSSNGRRSEWLHSFSFQSIHGVELNEIEWWIEEMNEVWRNQFTFFIHPQEWSSEWLKSRSVTCVNSIQWNTPIQSYLIEWCDFMNFINNIITFFICRLLRSLNHFIKLN